MKTSEKIIEYIQEHGTDYYWRTRRLPISPKYCRLDDAVGSGSTLNETAKKIRQKGLRKGKIIGLPSPAALKASRLLAKYKHVPPKTHLRYGQNQIRHRPANISAGS